MVKKTVNYITKDNIQKKASEWIKYVRSNVRERPNLIIDPKKCALLVIDVLNYFAHPEGRAYLPSSDAAVPNILKLIDCWKKQDSTIIFTRHCHKNKDSLGMLGKFYDDYIRCGESDSEITGELSVSSSDIVIEKETYDAFWNTGLQGILLQKKIEQVLITGCLSHLCCETTARSAFVRNFEVFFSCDSTFTNYEELHRGTLRAMADGFAVVMTTEEIIGLCQKG